MITVVSVVKNASNTIESMLESVHGQRGVIVEHVVVDGASSDGTLDKLGEWRPRLTALVSRVDSGMYFALNEGISLSTGDVLGVLHADDEFVDPFVLRDVLVLFDDPAVEFVYGDLAYVSRSAPTRILRSWRSGAYTPRKLRHGWMPPHPAVFIRRSLLARAGAYDVRYRIAADYDAIIRWLHATNPTAVRYIPRVLVRMRTGGASNRSLSQIIKKSREDYSIIRSHDLGGVGTLLAKNVRKVGQFL